MTVRAPRVRLLPPIAREREYTRLLWRLVSRAHKALTRRLEEKARVLGPLLPEAPREDARGLYARGDADPLQVLLSIVAEVRTLLFSIPAPMEALENQAAKVDKYATGQVARVIRSVVKIPTSALGSPLQEVHQQWALANADLITSMNTRYLNGVSKMVEKAVREGQTTRDLTKALQGRFQVARRHARLIARDQVSKLNGRITEARQTSLGVEYYRWSTSNDDRVRPTHVENDGKVFAWSSPPPETGHPGQDIQCRCVAIPIFDPDQVKMGAGG